MKDGAGARYRCPAGAVPIPPCTPPPPPPPPPPRTNARPDADGTIYAGIHLHVTDATGDGLLLEGTPDGSFAVYNTTVLTNEPSFPDMLAWAETYAAYNFSGVPGIAGAREPSGLLDLHRGGPASGGGGGRVSVPGSLYTY